MSVKFSVFLASAFIVHYLNSVWMCLKSYLYRFMIHYGQLSLLAYPKRSMFNVNWKHFCYYPATLTEAYVLSVTVILSYILTQISLTSPETTLDMLMITPECTKILSRGENLHLESKLAQLKLQLIS